MKPMLCEKILGKYNRINIELTWNTILFSFITMFINWILCNPPSIYSLHVGFFQWCERNIGFLEGFEESKEALLQDGFESGYKEVIQSSAKLGRIFGRRAIAAHLNKNTGMFFQLRFPKIY